MNVGDRVVIVRRAYNHHPSRMIGGTGTITLIEQGLYDVQVDNSPEDCPEQGVWSFYLSEIAPLT